MLKIDEELSLRESWHDRDLEGRLGVEGCGRHLMMPNLVLIYSVVHVVFQWNVTFAKKS